MADAKHNFNEESEYDGDTIELPGDPEECLPIAHSSKMELDKVTTFKKRTKHMKKYPELYRSDVSINPSYTGLRNLPYYVVCRRRFYKKKAKIIRQLNREIAHIAMMQTFAIDSAKNGYIKRITDDEVKSLVLEIAGTNVATTFISCPQNRKNVLGIRLPFLIMIIKNMKKYFTLEITILDDKDMHRRFRISNFQSTTRVRPFCTSMPIGLSGGWNQIQFNLADFTRRAYGTNYVETSRVQIHANCRIRRIYFSDRLYSEDEVPEEFKLFFSIRQKKCVREEKKEKGAASLEVPQSIKASEEPPEFYAENLKRTSEVAVPTVAEAEEIVEKQKPPVEVSSQEENLQVPAESAEAAEEEEATMDKAEPVEAIAPTEFMVEEEEDESEVDAPETKLSSEEEDG